MTAAQRSWKRHRRSASEARSPLRQRGALAAPRHRPEVLALLLERRDTALRLLSDQRQRLVAEALTAEERERKQLAQDLHDGAIQNLLAARHDLDAEHVVTLDLSAFAGLVPEEMLGQSKFPRIEQEPYLLTLGPRGFYWFRLTPADD